MKHYIILLFILICSCGTSIINAHANGVMDVEYSDVKGRVSVVVLAPVSISIHTVIRDQVAITTIVQQFRSDDKLRIRRYGLPLSESRSVTGIRYRIDTANWRVASIGRKDTTSHTGGKGSTVLPASSQFVGHVTEAGFTYEFQDSISGDHVVEIECTIMELLPLKRGALSYQVPFEHMPTYGVMSAIWSLSLKSSTTITDVYLPLSITDAKRDSMGITITEPTIATGVAVLSYRLRRDNVAAVVLSAKPRGEDGYALLFATPGGDTSAASMPRRFTIVIDVSGSMGGEKIVQAKAGAQKCIDQLGPDDEFNVILFESKTRMLWNHHMPVNPGNIHQARQYIDAAVADGGTNLEDALTRTFEMYRDSSAVNIAVFLTDGQASVQRPTLIATNRMRVRLLVIGVGSSVDEGLLRAIAADHRGLYFPVTTAGTLSAAIQSISEATRMPLMMNPTLSCAPNVLYDIAPGILPDIFMNEQFSVGARYKQPGDVVATVTGRGVNGQEEIIIRGTLADNDTVASYVPKIWAKMRIDLLITLMAGVSRNSRLWNEYRDEVIALGLKFGLVTPFTAFTGVTDGPTRVSDDEPSHITTCPSCAVVFPNPVRMNATVKVEFVGSHDVVHIRLVSVHGEVLLDTYAPGCTGGEWTYVLSLEQLPVSIAAATYILELTAGDEIRTVSIQVIR